MKAWIDIDNPPQVQYLLPVAKALEAAGDTVLLTARAYGITPQLLRDRGASAKIIGHEFGARRIEKVFGTLLRARKLVATVRAVGGVDVLIASSRSSALAARRLGVPCFILDDYEHSELGIYRRTGAYIVHPSLIPNAAYTSQGWPESRLINFDGIKEDLTFADVDFEHLAAHDFGPDVSELRRVLFRPPAEETHYYRARSRELALVILDHLAGAESTVTIFSPRHEHQVGDVRARCWTIEPIILDRPIPFLSLLAGVDLVVCSGGTMLREAAYMGVPAISIFQSQVGAVDATLEAEGRVTHVNTINEFVTATSKLSGPKPVRRTPGVREAVLREIRARLNT